MTRFTESEDQAKVRWEQGKDFELEWWQQWLREKGQQWHAEYKDRLDPDRPLQQHLRDCIGAPPGSEVEILDVGAGPLTLVGKRWEGRKVRVTAIDPLAAQYDKLLAASGITPPVRTQEGQVERLSELIPAASFDLVHMQNALDHSYDPILGIRQMLSVTKPGCSVVLSHFINEAEEGAYVGFHQWNLCADGGRFIIWNQDHRYCVDEEVAGMARVTLSASDADRWITVRLRKEA